MDVQFVKDRYDYELQRKEQLTAALTLSVGILSILSGGIGCMARWFSYSDLLLAELFAPIIVADVMTVCVCLIYLGRAFQRRRYAYLPFLQELLTWEREYDEFAHHFQQDGAQREDAFLQRLIEATDRNTANNDSRSELLYRARVALFAVLCISALAGIPYVVDQVRQQMSRPEIPTGPVPPNSRPSPPPAPPNREIREGDVPPGR